MKCVFTWKATVMGIALATSMWTGVAVAEGEFTTLGRIPAQAMSHSEMAAVEGKSQGNAIDVLGPGGLLYTTPGQTNNPLVLVKLSQSALAVSGPGGLLYSQPARTTDPTVLVQLFGGGSGQAVQALGVAGRGEGGAV